MTLEERHARILERCVESLKTWKELITEYLDEDDCATEVGKLKQTTEGYCDINRDFNKSLRALKNVEEHLNKSDECTEDVDKQYEEFLTEESLNEVEAPYTKLDIWESVFQGVDDVVEVKRKKKNLKDNEFDELDDSLFCSNTFTPPIDPISKVVIRDPVKSKQCKHVYERAMIYDYIKQQKRKAKCPYIGCSSNRLTISDIVDDSQLQSQITQYLENKADDTEDEDTL